MVNRCEIFNIFDFMCGTIANVLEKLGERVYRDELLYLSLIEKIESTCNNNKHDLKLKRDNISQEFRQKKLQAQCIKDFEDSEIICDRCEILSLHFECQKEILSTSKLIVWIVYVGKNECLLIDYFANDYQILLFKKEKFDISENYLLDYIIQNTPFCAKHRHILAITDDNITVEHLFERKHISIERIGMNWLVAVKKYVEDMNFVQTKFVPVIREMLNANFAKQKVSLKNNFKYCSTRCNSFGELVDYLKCFYNSKKK